MKIAPLEIELTDHQKEVVKLMQDGWKLKVMNLLNYRWQILLYNESENKVKPQLNVSTFNGLKSKLIIETNMTEHTTRVYTLTEFGKSLHLF